MTIHRLEAHCERAGAVRRACNSWLMSCCPSGGEMPMRSPTDFMAVAGKQHTRTPTVCGGTCAASETAHLACKSLAPGKSLA